MEPLAYLADVRRADRAAEHFALHRRAWLKTAAIAGGTWLTPVAEALARRAEQSGGHEPAQSVILLWLAGGPSQLETFDPHPGTAIAGGTAAIDTALRGVQLATGYERLAEQLADVSLVRSLTSKEGDHERGTYLVKTGYRPDPTVVHPSIGAICCHQLPVGKTEIPRHVSILPNQWPARGGFLGNSFDAFKTFDPADKVPDVSLHVPDARQAQRLADRAMVDRAFAAGRRRQFDATLHGQMIDRAVAMMGSEQLKAFDIAEEPAELRTAYGNTPFGRGCLAARRLIEQGVRCVEVTLAGWDSHTNNHEAHARLAQTLDPAFAALIADLRERDLLSRTVVLCGGEFGRTPRINALDGRDHWPHGFTVALAGGGIRGGQVIGETDPEGGRKVSDPRTVADIHATILTALAIDPAHEETSPAGRPIKFSEGMVIGGLLDS
ncbi:MAG: DUF1501 domain-containing protein [Planctomycetia bacterium]|nr:DUF1501 domain-containing protein [Planctomycetia bacterium]